MKVKVPVEESLEGRNHLIHLCITSAWHIVGNQYILKNILWMYKLISE